MSEEKQVIELPDEIEIEAVLGKIRPYIQQDGGDIEFLGVDENAIVYVAFRGACAGCMMAASDFQDGIKDIIMEEVANVRDVMLVG